MVGLENTCDVLREPKKRPPTHTHAQLRLGKGGPGQALAAHPAPVGLDPGSEAVHVLHAESG